MTRKFEQEYASNLNFNLSLEKNKPRPLQGDRDGLESWCDTIQTSSWAVKSHDAHLK